MIDDLDDDYDDNDDYDDDDDDDEDDDDDNDLEKKSKNAFGFLRPAEEFGFPFFLCVFLKSWDFFRAKRANV